MTMLTDKSTLKLSGLVLKMEQDHLLGTISIYGYHSKGKVKCLYLYWITLSAFSAVLPRSPVRVAPHGSSVTERGNRGIRRKRAMLGRDKLDNILLTCDRDNFNQITAWSRNRTLVTVVRDTCTTTVPPASQACFNRLVTAYVRSLKANISRPVFKLYTSFQMEYSALLSNLPLQLYLKILKNQFINNLWKISITGFKITDLC